MRKTWVMVQNVLPRKESAWRQPATKSSSQQALCLARLVTSTSPAPWAWSRDSKRAACWYRGVEGSYHSKHGHMSPHR